MTSDIINKMKRLLSSLSQENEYLLTKWMAKKTDLIVKENQPNNLRDYRKGDIICIDFGFNIGKEYGGIHYAVVLKKSSRCSPLVTVMPLTSLKQKNGKTEQDEINELSNNLIYLGTIDGINKKKSVAKLNQIVTLSKLRIIYPKSRNQRAYKLDNDTLDLIDSKLKKFFRIDN